MKYIVIGGAGQMGRIAVRDLAAFAEESDEIVVADYDGAKATEVARALGDARVSALQLDVRDSVKSARALAGAFVLLNCLQHTYNLIVMAAALRVRAHYIDLGGLFHVTRQQLPLDAQFRKAQRVAILGMGAAPGITNVLARAGADRLDTVTEIHCRVAGVDRTKYKDFPALPIAYSLETILDEFSTPPAVFSHGKFIFVAPMSGMTPMRFPAPIGMQRPMHTIHSEVATLPLSFKHKGVREVSFKIAFPAALLDRLKFLRDFGFASHDPISIAGIKVTPIEVANKVAASQTPARRAGPLKQFEIVRTIVKGTRRNEKWTLVLDCSTHGHKTWALGTDINTGCPPAIVARMLASGEISGAGVYPPETIVSHEPFFKQLRRRGIAVRTSERRGCEGVV